VRRVRRFSFVHVADVHLGYSQYGLEARKEDFDRVFTEVVDKTLNLKPDFMIIAGDLFHNAKPSNITLEKAIRNFARLREAKIPVLTVDGSHDSAPNIVTGSIMNPLDTAGLIYYLPRHESACWRKEDCCYVYGIPNFRTHFRTKALLPGFFGEHKPEPDPSLYNIFVFHMAVDLPSVTPSYIHAEVSAESLPEGFDYYSAGHIHKPYEERFKSGVLVYSGCVETVDFEEAGIRKGFYHVKVSEGKQASLNFIELQNPRRFIVLEEDFSDLSPQKITERAVRMVRDADEKDVVLILVLKGVLPEGATRGEVDLSKVRAASTKALIVHLVVALREKEMPEEAVRNIFDNEFKDMKVKAFEYFCHLFSKQYGNEKAKALAQTAIGLIDPLNKKQEEIVKKALEDTL